MKKLIAVILSLSMLLSVTCGVDFSAFAEECEHPSYHLENDKAATTSEEGYTGDKVCDVCGETIAVLPSGWVTADGKQYYYY